jgi:hypothetical protein
MVVMRAVGLQTSGCLNAVRATTPLMQQQRVPSFLGNSIDANNREMKFYERLFIDIEPVNSVHNKSAAAQNVRFSARRSR